MYKILRANTRLAGTVFSELDTNFLEVCNALLKLAIPDSNLKGYADNAREPVTPGAGDCYLVVSDTTVWALPVEKNNLICWNGSAWEILPYKITELNTALQTLFFDAENISFIPPPEMTSTNIQDALEELAAALFGSSGNNASGSGSNSQ